MILISQLKSLILKTNQLCSLSILSNKYGTQIRLLLLRLFQVVSNGFQWASHFVNTNLKYLLIRSTNITGLILPFNHTKSF